MFGFRFVVVGHRKSVAAIKEKKRTEKGRARVLFRYGRRRVRGRHFMAVDSQWRRATSGQQPIGNNHPTPPPTPLTPPPSRPPHANPMQMTCKSPPLGPPRETTLERDALIGSRLDGLPG